MVMGTFYKCDNVISLFHMANLQVTNIDIFYGGSPGKPYADK
jgi:hypothetical protein